MPAIEQRTRSGTFHLPLQACRMAETRILQLFHYQLKPPCAPPMQELDTLPNAANIDHPVLKDAASPFPLVAEKWPEEGEAGLPPASSSRLYFESD